MTNEWQPMGTAPTDGTLILVYDGSHIATARWSAIFKDFESEDTHLDDGRLVAWMPLPDPPKTIPEEVA